MRHNHTAPPQDRRKYLLSQDPILPILKNASKQELEDYIEANSLTLPEMRELIKKLAHIVQYLYNQS